MTCATDANPEDVLEPPRDGLLSKGRPSKGLSLPSMSYVELVAGTFACLRSISEPRRARQPPVVRDLSKRAANSLSVSESNLIANELSELN